MDATASYETRQRTDATGRRPPAGCGGEPPDDIVISGASGVGKTVLAKLQVDDLRFKADVCSTQGSDDSRRSL